MPTLTTNYSLQKPLVNSAVDQDLWGGQLNDDMDDIDGLLKQGITVTVQSSQTTGFTATTSISVKYLYPCDATGGAFAATLPTAATAGNGSTVFIKKTDATTNAITVTRSSSDTIDGATTYAIDNQNEVAGFVSDGVSKWYVLTDGQINIPDATTSVKGIVELATAAEVKTGSSTTLVPSVSAMASHQGILKAWVSFSLNGTVADSYNVSSVTDTSSSAKVINLSITMANSSYGAAITQVQSAGTTYNPNMTITNRTTTALTIFNEDEGNNVTGWTVSIYGQL